ncbi:MAG: hypothetical protein AAF797_14315 [Planctomycetota bacterium]
MKLLFRLTLVVVLLVVLAVGALWFFLDDIVTGGLRVALGEATGTPTTLDAASVKVLGQTVRVEGLAIGNPEGKGYSETPAIKFNSLESQVELMSLLGDKPYVKYVHLDAAAISAELSGTSLNLYDIKANLDAATGGGGTAAGPMPVQAAGLASALLAQAGGGSAEAKYKIDEIKVTGATVAAGGQLVGLGSVPSGTLPLPDITLTNLDGTMNEIALQVLGQLIDTAIQEAGIPDLGELAKQAEALVKEKVGEVKEQVDQKVEEGKQKLEEEKKKLEEKAKDLVPEGLPNPFGN